MEWILLLFLAYEVDHKADQIRNLEKQVQELKHEKTNDEKNTNTSNTSLIQQTEKTSH